MSILFYGLAWRFYVPSTDLHILNAMINVRLGRISYYMDNQTVGVYCVCVCVCVINNVHL